MKLAKSDTISSDLLRNGSRDEISGGRKNPSSISKFIDDVKLGDFDGDGDLDLYLASGGVEISEFSNLYQDYLYFNDGQGNFADPKQIFSNDQNF